MGDADTGQVSKDAAGIYEKYYLPAMFEEWPPLVVDAAKIQRGDKVIDIGCGTGALAMTVLQHTGTEGVVTGVDINQNMLDIARSKSDKIDWIQAPAESLPFEDASFDRAVSQFGLMYFENQSLALKEMMRVIKPGGSITVVVWDSLENNPGFAAEEQLWQQLFGEENADEIPWSLGSRQILLDLFEGARITDINIKTHRGTARFSSVENWIHTGAKGWAQDEALDHDQLALLLETAKQQLTRFETADGSAAFSTSAHIITTVKG